MSEAPPLPGFLAAGDQALLVRFADTASDAALAAVWRLAAALVAQPIAGVVHHQPSYAALLVRFDPLRTDARRLEGALRERLAQAVEAEPAAPAREIEIPVAYGGEHGPDLESVAAHCGMTASQVVAAHSGARYRVAFFGFVAGFAYLSGLPERLATPRLPSPRPRVPPGSVGIGGAQSAVYPSATPGGWRLVGRTPLVPARFSNQPATLFAPGDAVRFVPIGPAEFARRSQWR